MDQHTIETLEFGKIVESIAGHCLTDVGRELTGALIPDTEFARIKKQAAQVDQMISILLREGDFPLSRAPDIRPALLHTALEGSFLEPKELLGIAAFLDLCQDLMKFSR